MRNTGHDYLGKSTGAGALGIWTHGMKDISFLDYTSGHYSDRAMRMGAGVQGPEAFQAAHEQGYVVLGGECATVGIAGGYTQGGGHSALSSKYGLAADQALEWEVVDGSGRFLRATPDNEHADLYWALSGGGGGTYGVVVSLTARIYPELPVSGLNLTFTNVGGTRTEAFWDAVQTYHASFPAMVDEGVMSFEILEDGVFALAPLTGPGVSIARLRELVAPLTTRLNELGLEYGRPLPAPFFSWS